MTTRLPKIEQVPDCISCGACCLSNNPRYLRVTGEDYARLGELAASITQFIENRCYIRTSANRCVALRIDPRTKSYFCTLYELRPQICRELAVGSPNCLAEIERKHRLARSVLNYPDPDQLSGAPCSGGNGSLGAEIKSPAAKSNITK